MRAVIQRVKEASVTVEGDVISRIEKGFLILLGIEVDDSAVDIVWLAKEIGKKIQTGTFGAMMDVALVNDGPVTIIMDSKNKE